MIENVHYSFLEEYKTLCEYNDKENGSKGYSKYNGWSWMQGETNIILCTKQEWCDDDWSKKKVIGMKSGKRMGISVMYNFRSYLDIGKGKIAIRIIPCGCNGCLE